VPSASNQTFSAFPTSDYAKLPTVSFVVPNLQHDMHDGTVQQADTWLAQNLGGYVRWAQTHDSLLVVTWDEDDESASNHIPTIFVGPMVRRGPDDTHITHLDVLATIEAMYGLPPSSGAARATPITTSWG
jgi:phosphatidylinositol-3-phosphatase